VTPSFDAYENTYGPPAVRVKEWLAHGWLLLAVLAVALLERALIDTTPDVSWLITLGEKVLDGQRPYVDFLEVNPPASIFLYLPAVAVARATGIAAEFAVGLFVFAAVAASLWISARIVRETGILKDVDLGRLAALFAAALLVLPGQTFGQREHIALICFLPLLAVCAARAEGKPVVLHWAIIAGIGAGIVVAIKPHLAFGVLFAATTAAICARSWRPVFAVENWIAAALAAVYVAVVFAAFPAFVSELMPLVMMVYVPQKTSLADFLTVGSIPFWFASLVIIIALKRGAAFSPPFVLLLASSLGFAIAFVIQQKGWAYHAYPMIALSLVGAVIAFFDRWPVDSMKSAAAGERAVCLGTATAIALVAGTTFYWFTLTLDTRPLIEPIRKSVSRPTVLNISNDQAVGHPLTRQVGGRWVGHTCGQWISAGAMTLKKKGVDARTAALLDAYIERDRAGLIEDIARAKPDIILVDQRFDWLNWAKADPALARQLDGYHELTTINDILVLRRNQAAG
jgi:hypothetical protein